MQKKGLGNMVELLVYALIGIVVIIVYEAMLTGSGIATNSTVFLLLKYVPVGFALGIFVAAFYSAVRG